MLFEGQVGYCPWHKRDSSFSMVQSIRFASPRFYRSNLSTEGSPEGPTRTGILILECRHCGQSVILLEHEVRMPAEADEGEGKSYAWRTMVAPPESPRSLPGSAPEAVRSLFAEASTCEKAGALRAAGVMYRATVEEIVKDQNGTGRDLYAKINSLEVALSPELVEDLHEARLLGNYSIHEGVEFSREEVEDVASLIEEAVLVVYVQPEEKKAMREARKARRGNRRV